MTIEEEIFKNAKIDLKKLIKYGFKKEKSIYKYSKNIMSDSFKVEIEITNDGVVKGKIYDLSFNEEYINYRLTDTKGAFASDVKNEFEIILKDIKSKCSTTEIFTSSQANRITKFIKEKYKDDLLFLWEKYPEDAVFKNKDTHKWYGVLMNIDKSKLEKNITGEVEIIDIKLDPIEIKDLLKKTGFYPAYHMNKKNWITIVLNDTISDKEIMNLINKSYMYSENKK